jgi:L-amino acid N-acyltransferase YncA
MTPLIDAAKKLNMHTIIASVDASNEPSLRLHKSFRFEEVAHFKEGRMEVWKMAGFEIFAVNGLNSEAG